MLLLWCLRKKDSGDVEKMQLKLGRSVLGGTDRRVPFVSARRFLFGILEQVSQIAPQLH